MTKIFDKKCIDSLHIWHSRCKDPDIHFRYCSQWGDAHAFSLSVPDAEELYSKLSELLIKAKSYVPPDDEEYE